MPPTSDETEGTPFDLEAAKCWTKRISADALTPGMRLQIGAGPLAFFVRIVHVYTYKALRRPTVVAELLDGTVRRFGPDASVTIAV